MQSPEQNADMAARLIRLLYMLLFAVLFKAAEFVMWVVTVFQIIMTLLTGDPNERVLKFGKQLSLYVYSLWMYLTYNTERRPFPFSDWPTTGSTPAASPQPSEMGKEN